MFNSNLSLCVCDEDEIPSHDMFSPNVLSQDATAYCTPVKMGGGGFLNKEKERERHVGSTWARDKQANVANEIGNLLKKWHWETLEMNP